MPTGPKRVLMGAAAAFFALGLPAGALAGNGGKCNASACKVYVEQGVPNAGGQKQVEPKPTSSSTNSNVTHEQHPSNVSRVLAHAGGDKKALSQLMGASGLGRLQPGNGSVAAPSALGAIFSLGVGPTVLFALLLATGLGLALRGSMRGWRRKRSNAI